MSVKKLATPFQERDQASEMAPIDLLNVLPMADMVLFHTFAMLFNNPENHLPIAFHVLVQAFCTGFHTDFNHLVS